MKKEVERVAFGYKNFMGRYIEEEVIFYDVDLTYFKLENCNRDKTKLHGSDFVDPYFLIGEDLIDIDEPNGYLVVEINKEFAGYAIYGLSLITDGRPAAIIYFLEVFPLARGRNIGQMLQDALVIKLGDVPERVLLINGACVNKGYWELMQKRSGPGVEVIFEG